MRRHRVRPFGHSISATRTMSLLMSLAVIWMLYSWVREPATWVWLEDLNGSTPMVVAPGAENTPAAGTPAAQAAGPPAVAAVEETIVPGPNDQDPEEWEKFQEKQEWFTDKAPLRVREMALYWKLMEWSRTEPFKKLEARADAKSSFSQIWEEPKRFRGKLVRLRMHVRRVLEYPTEDNPLGLKKAYELWGWTEDSKSYPYVVVVPELPAGLAIGPDVRGEVVFVGYFFKILSYSAFDVARGAPMLIGRLRKATPGVAPIPINSSSTWILAGTLIGIAIFAGIAIRYLMKLRPHRSPVMLPDGLNEGAARSIFEEGWTGPADGQFAVSAEHSGEPLEPGWTPGRLS